MRGKRVFGRPHTLFTPHRNQRSPADALTARLYRDYVHPPSNDGAGCDQRCIRGHLDVGMKVSHSHPHPARPISSTVQTHILTPSDLHSRPFRPTSSTFRTYIRIPPDKPFAVAVPIIGLRPSQPQGGSLRLYQQSIYRQITRAAPISTIHCNSVRHQMMGAADLSEHVVRVLHRLKGIKSV